MKFSTVLLLASLASVSLAVIPEPEDEILLETQPTDAPAQSSPTSHPGKDSVSNEVISEENVVIESIGPKSQKPELPHPIIQEDSFRNAEIQQEKATELNSSSATTSESELDNYGREIKKDLNKAVKRIMGFLKDLIPGADDVMRP